MHACARSHYLLTRRKKKWEKVRGVDGGNKRETQITRKRGRSHATKARDREMWELASRSWQWSLALLSARMTQSRSFYSRARAEFPREIERSRVIIPAPARIYARTLYRYILNIALVPTLFFNFCDPTIYCRCPSCSFSSILVCRTAEMKICVVINCVAKVALVNAN